ATPYRVHRVPVWSPTGWAEAASRNRVGDFVAWERQTAQPKYGISFGVHYTTTLGVAELYDYKWYFSAFFYGARERAARILGVEPGTRLVAHSRRAFDMWNTRYFVLPYYPKWDDEFRGIASFIDHTERIHPPPDAFVGPDGRGKEVAWAKHHDYQIRRNLDEYARAWVVHEARPFPEFGDLGRAARVAPMEEILYSNDMTWSDPSRSLYDPRRCVWLDEAVLPALSGS